VNFFALLQKLKLIKDAKLAIFANLADIKHDVMDIKTLILFT